MVDDNLSHKGEINGRNYEFHGPSFSTAPFKKVAFVTVSLISIILFMEAFFSTPWGSSNVVSCSHRLRISFVVFCSQGESNRSLPYVTSNP